MSSNSNKIFIKKLNITDANLKFKIIYYVLFALFGICCACIGYGIYFIGMGLTPFGIGFGFDFGFGLFGTALVIQGIVTIIVSSIFAVIFFLLMKVIAKKGEIKTITEEFRELFGSESKTKPSFIHKISKEMWGYASIMVSIVLYIIAFYTFSQFDVVISIILMVSGIALDVIGGILVLKGMKNTPRKEGSSKIKEKLQKIQFSKIRGIHLTRQSKIMLLVVLIAIALTITTLILIVWYFNSLTITS